VIECVVKPLCVFKVTVSKPAGTKNPTMLSVGVAQDGCNPGDFDGLNAPESRFLKPQVNHDANRSKHINKQKQYLTFSN
jgi:hypothetical protein